MDLQEEIGSERERQAWRLRIKGWTQQEIADELQVTQQAVSLALRRIAGKLADAFIDEAREIKALQTEQLFEVYRTAMEQWIRSCQDGEKRTVTTGRVKATEHGYVDLPDQETLTVEGQSGNPALLTQAMKALADMRAIWGWDAPAKADVTSGGQSIGDWTQIRGRILSVMEGYPEAKVALAAFLTGDDTADGG
jgi:predicted transcriptional regulator